SGNLGRVACLVTGASRGFGRSVARLLAARLVPGSLLLLAARSAGALEGELHVQALPADLGADEGLQRVARDAADALRCHHNSARLQRLLLLNNAGERMGATGRREHARGVGGRPLASARASWRASFVHVPKESTRARSRRAGAQEGALKRRRTGATSDSGTAAGPAEGGPRSPAFAPSAVCCSRPAGRPASQLQ
ncbi:hypothetical protein JRQ81_008354, partial [Phrynocephalus forsythii]